MTSQNIIKSKLPNWGWIPIGSGTWVLTTSQCGYPPHSCPWMEHVMSWSTGNCAPAPLTTLSPPQGQNNAFSIQGLYTYCSLLLKHSSAKCSYAGTYSLGTQLKCNLRESYKNDLFKAMLSQLYHVMRHIENSISFLWAQGKLTMLAHILPAILKAGRANISVSLRPICGAKDHWLGLKLIMIN